jgi:glutamate transport system substrate-binding protein
MKRRKFFLVAAVAAAAVTLGACGSSGSGPGGSGTSGNTGTYKIQKADNLPASPTLDAIRQRGKIIVGTKFDQPLFGQQNPTNNQVEGFDTEIARILAIRIFGDPSKVQFLETVSKNREPFIQQGKVDAVVATYTINAKRKKLVDFAGPYYVAGQDIMVKTGNTSINSVADLNGKKVCTVQGSTSETNLREKAPQAQVLTLDTYSACAEALGDGRVDAETTDNVILLGLISQNSGAYKLVGKPFTSEPYGIGLRKGDNVFRTFVNDTLQEIYTNGDWAKAFASTVGAVEKNTPAPPAVDRYTTAS